MKTNPYSLFSACRPASFSAMRTTMDPLQSICGASRVIRLSFTVTAALFAFTLSAGATTYYSKGNLGAAGVTNWSSTMDGTGAGPADFTSTTDTFVIQSGNTMTSPGWTCAGAVQIDSGGVLVLGGGNATLGSLLNNGTVTLATGVNSRTLNLKGNLVNNGTINSGTTGANQTIKLSANASWNGSGNVTGGRVQLVVDSGVTLDISGVTTGIKFKSGSTMASTIDGTLITGTKVLDGNTSTVHTFNLATGATLVTANTGGVNGTFINWGAGKVVLNTGASYTFNGTAAQDTGALIPATVKNLSIDNTSGVTLSNTTTAVDGTLLMKTNTSLLTNAVTIGGGSTLISLDGAGNTISSSLAATAADAVFTSNAAAAAGVLLTGQVTGTQGVILDVSTSTSAATALTVTLNNGTNNYAGDTVINRIGKAGASATLALGAANQIPNGVGVGNVTINSALGTGTLNLAGFSETINGLNGNGTVDNLTSGTNTFTIGDNNANGEFSGAIKNTTGTLSLTKTGTGTQTLSATNTYSGATTISQGKLVMGDAAADTFATSGVTVASGAALGGSGTITNTVGVTGILAPGITGVSGGIGTLAAGTTTWKGAASSAPETIWQFDLSATSGTSDTLAITGDFKNDSTSGTVYKFDFMSSAPNAWGNTYTLATWTGATDFTNANQFSFAGLSGSYNGLDSYFTLNANSLTFTAVPEPTSALAGLLITAGLLRRRRA